MTDVLIFFTADKRSAATRLGEGLASAGYAAELEELPDENALAAVDARAAAAAAALLIWSRRLVSETLFGDGLAIRRHTNLIEVSTDGIAPIGSVADEQRVVLISGWRGQPYHQGWRAILARLKALAGARAAAAPAHVPTRPAQQAGKPTPDPSRGRSAAPPAPRRRALRIAFGSAAAAGLLVLAVLGWRSEHQPAATPPQPAPTALPSPDETVPAPAVPQPGPAPQQVEAPMPPSQAGAPAPETPKPVAGRLRPPRARKTAPVPLRDVHYSARNSRTMRLFCERSGRNTPQCRVFRNATQP
jgi:hypothetical protein